MSNNPKENLRSTLHKMKESSDSIRLTLSPPEIIEELQEDIYDLKSEIKELQEENACIRQSYKEERKQNEDLEARLLFLYTFLRYHGLEQKATHLETSEKIFFKEYEKMKDVLFAQSIGLKARA